MRAVVLLLATALCCGNVHAQVPRQINYQGLLTNPGGTPVTATVAMEFRLYAVASGPDAPLYSETENNVAVANGAFSVLIGSVTPIPGSVLFDQPYYLGVKVGADNEMTPRPLLAASPYALRAASATTADALAAGATVAGSQITGALGSLTLTGNLVLAHPSTAVTGNIMKGANRFIHNYGFGNTFMGENAGSFSSASANTGTGYTALSSNSGEWNTAHGYEALTRNQGGSYNTALGMGTLLFNVSGVSNTAVGMRALANSLMSNNIGVGANAGVNLSTGGDNIAKHGTDGDQAGHGLATP